jgi:hypothetical protein
MSTDPVAAAPSSRRTFSTSQLLAALDANVRTPGPHQDVPEESPTFIKKPAVSAVPTVRRRKTPKPPKDSKVYKVAMGCVALRAQGMRGQEVADALGVKYDTMRTYLKRATAKGWLNINSFGDTEDKVEYVLADKAIRNANDLLDSEDVHVRKEMTIETLKGTGVFKSHQAVKVENNSTVGLALKVLVEMPVFPAGQPQLMTVRPGSTGGAHGVSIPADAEIMGEVV